MDAIMRESSFAQYMIRQYKQEGREEGERNSTLENISEVLAIRFGPGVADLLADRLAAVDEVPHLKQLHRLAIQVASLEAFQQALEA